MKEKSLLRGRRSYWRIYDFFMPRKKEKKGERRDLIEYRRKDRLKARGENFFSFPFASKNISGKSRSHVNKFDINTFPIDDDDVKIVASSLSCAGQTQHTQVMLIRRDAWMLIAWKFSRGVKFDVLFMCESFVFVWFDLAPQSIREHTEPSIVLFWGLHAWLPSRAHSFHHTN